MVVEDMVVAVNERLHAMPQHHAVQIRLRAQARGGAPSSPVRAVDVVCRRPRQRVMRQYHFEPRLGARERRLHPPLRVVHIEPLETHNAQSEVALWRRASEGAHPTPIHQPKVAAVPTRQAAIC